MYTIMHDLLDEFYSELEITVRSSDATPAVKVVPRRKNCLMQVGCVDEANLLAKRVSAITPSSISWLCKVYTRMSAKLAWDKVREVIHGTRRVSTTTQSTVLLHSC